MSHQIEGKVLSTKMQNTLVVQIEQKYRHPRYRKVILRHKKVKAHNEDASIKEGDMVTIEETKPISKQKHFKVVKNS